jgi:hypothetical protein
LLIDVAARWMLLAQQAEQNQRVDHAERNH